MSNIKTLTTPVNFWGDNCDTLVVMPGAQVDLVAKKVTAQVVICPAANIVNGLPQTTGVTNPANPNQQGLKLVKGFSKSITVTVTSTDSDTVIAALVTASGYAVNA